MKKYLITGGSGNLGQEIIKLGPQFGFEFLSPIHKDFDITNVSQCWRYLEYAKHWFGLNGIIHCAAYTNVPGAEKEKIKQ